jgi:phosphodiesterase/alkaline phosphatase D-like protein
VHTPLFPNGGHVGDAMWYGGNNTPRATVAGKPLANGIIERRDDLLRIIQAHPKVLAVLTGDEHNYNKTRLDAKVPIYPPNWDKAKVELQRPFWQINNGAAGAPYYAQDDTPLSAAVSGFSTQHAICLIIVEGRKVLLETVNPETLEVLDRAVLR